MAHRDVLDAFLCRARARLKLGDGMGARADAATACAMAGWKQECWNFRKTRGGKHPEFCINQIRIFLCLR